MRADTQQIQVIIEGSNMYVYNLSHLSHTQESAPVETQERPFPLRLQQQANIKQQLVNVYVSFLTVFLLL